MEDTRQDAQYLDKRQPALAGFIRTVLPPLVSRYALRMLRIAAMTPAGRMVTIWAFILLTIALLGPAALVAAIIWLSTQDSRAAFNGFIAVAVLCAAVFVILAFRLRSNWKRWRRTHFN